MTSSIAQGPLLSAARRHAVVSPFSFTPASYQCRQFTVSSQHRSVPRGMPQTISAKQPAQPSMRARRGNLSRSELPQDLGLLPGTFIKPLWRDLPSIFQQPKERLQFEWLWLKTGFQNFLGLFMYLKVQFKGQPLRLKERRQVARELHKRMYSAFAEGDATTLRKICCTGLANNLISRIESRPKGEKVTWSLDNYIRSPSTFFTGVRVVADRATQIPELPDSGIRQVTLRITSRQSTSRSQRQRGGDEVQSGKKQQDCTEYIVLQKLRWFGEEEEWRIWGHATPTTLEDLESPFFATGIPFSERMQAMREAIGQKN
ncbi:hypothetical protein BJX61DRAFT_271700 [Aspergillus egyptiacus]|nr:hypothetical protein BJX61DRAFT_271700 [Aspergillus egyptiacus]